MEKRVVEVYVPALLKKYEIIIPSTMKIGILNDLLAKIISEEEKVRIKNETLILGNMDFNKKLDDDLTVNEVNIKDGSSLIFI